MKKVLILAVTALMIGGGQYAGAAGPASARAVAAGPVKITVTYKGKGTVDASHRIWVWLFDSPNIGAGSVPVDQVALDKNGAAAVFENVLPGQVYIAVAFDEAGVMQGDAPPPSGTPISVLMGDSGAPVGIVPGEKGIATLTFDDSMRMP